jgi:ribosomal protein L22
MTERPTNTQPDKQHKVAAPVSQSKAPTQHEEKKTDVKVEEKKHEEHKKAAPKKEEVSATGVNLNASLKHSMAVSKFIKGMKIEQAIEQLTLVTQKRRAVPMRGEIPHRHGNIMAGRYPINTSNEIISVLKTLRGNCVAHGLSLDKARITFASPSWAARPQRRGGRLGKRLHIVIKAREVAVKNG